MKNWLKHFSRIVGIMGRKRQVSYQADFETTTDPNDCRVWGWGLADIEKVQSPWDVEMGTNIQWFIDRISEESSTVYFHNLKFDGHFILDYLFRELNFTHVDKYPGRGQFSTLISSMGAFYTITVCWENGKRTEFRDSLKKLPFSVSTIAKAFKQTEMKGSIDYHSPRPVGHMLTQEERAYLATDIVIPAKALKTQFDAGMTKLTVGSDSLAEFKKVIGQRHFDKMFPVLPLTMDSEIRQAYRGGFTYADPRFKGKITGPGIVYDVNSLYPSVMYDRLLPCGEPIYTPGLPAATESHPLFIVSVTFTAKLKKNHIPCIQIRGNSHFLATEYQTHIKDPVTLMCTNVDLALWEDHYDMNILSYNGGWLFEGIEGLFVEYIDKWMEVKKNSTGGMRALAKLMLNSLYGKFATNPLVTGKVPVFEENVVKLVMGPEETRDPVYTAMGVFITAYARDVTIRTAQEHYGVFAYADTDSLHLLIPQDPPTLDVDPQKLGAWKREYAFEKGLFVRAKAYIEQRFLADVGHGPADCDNEEGHNNCVYVTHIAGLPDRIAHVLTIDDFIGGRKFEGKLVPKRVPGGIVLEDVDFTMNME